MPGILILHKSHTLVVNTNFYYLGKNIEEHRNSQVILKQASSGPTVPYQKLLPQSLKYAGNVVHPKQTCDAMNFCVLTAAAPNYLIQIVINYIKHLTVV